MSATDPERLLLIRKALQEHHWDGLVLFHPDSVLMASGMFPGSTHVVAVVDADGQVAIITPWWREQFTRAESWADTVFCFDWCKPSIVVDPLLAMKDLLQQCRFRLRLEKVGYEGRPHHYSPAQLPSELFTYDEVKEELAQIFPLVEDGTGVIHELKSTKTAREVRKLRLTNRVAWEGVQAFYRNAVPGIRECELAAEVNYAVLKIAGTNGIQYTYCDPPQITSGPERTVIADTMSNHATERRLEQGDPVMLEFGVHADGYWADITRCLIVGGPEDVHEKIHQAVIAAQQSAVAAYVPFQTSGRQLCEAAWESMKSAGFGPGITHGLGHGLGFAYHEDRPELGPASKDIIRPGHVTSIEPGLYWNVAGRPVAGIRVEDNVVWGMKKGQAEVLSDFYRGLGGCFGAKVF